MKIAKAVSLLIIGLTGWMLYLKLIVWVNMEIQSLLLQQGIEYSDIIPFLSNKDCLEVITAITATVIPIIVLWKKDSIAETLDSDMLNHSQH